MPSYGRQRTSKISTTWILTRGEASTLGEVLTCVSRWRRTLRVASQLNKSKRDRTYSRSTRRSRESLALRRARGSLAQGHCDFNELWDFPTRSNHLDFCVRAGEAVEGRPGSTARGVRVLQAGQRVLWVCDANRVQDGALPEKVKSWSLRVL